MFIHALITNAGRRDWEKTHLAVTTKKDILSDYRQGFSRSELKEMYKGIDPRYIDIFCDQEDRR